MNTSKHLARRRALWGQLTSTLVLLCGLLFLGWSPAIVLLTYWMGNALRLPFLVWRSVVVERRQPVGQRNHARTMGYAAVYALFVGVHLVFVGIAAGFTGYLDVMFDAFGILALLLGRLPDVAPSLAAAATATAILVENLVGMGRFYRRVGALPAGTRAFDVFFGELRAVMLVHVMVLFGMTVGLALIDPESRVAGAAFGVVIVVVKVGFDLLVPPAHRV